MAHHITPSSKLTGIAQGTTVAGSGPKSPFFPTKNVKTCFISNVFGLKFRILISQVWTFPCLQGVGLDQHTVPGPHYVPWTNAAEEDSEMCKINFKTKFYCFLCKKYCGSMIHHNQKNQNRSKASQNANIMTNTNYFHNSFVRGSPDFFEVTTHLGRVQSTMRLLAPVQPPEVKVEALYVGIQYAKDIG